MGNRLTSFGSCAASAVHPHRHGEQKCTDIVLDNRSGSSPQAWGTVQQRTKQGVTIRFIPTGMGNSFLHKLARVFAPVHPHRHGEQRRRLVFRCARLGSSPQAWGTVCRSTHCPTNARFIPTGMGNRFTQLVNLGLTPVHPHRHGEQAANVMCGFSHGGSSPQAWGTE